MRRLKALVEKIPYCIGKWLARVPFSWRLGGVYVRMWNECHDMERGDEMRRSDYAVEQFRKVFEYARESFSCYRKMYEQAGVLDLEIRSLSDVAKIPTIDKAWARKHFQEFRGAYRLNTGGSSGEPTAFWTDKNCWAREWAHMHTIWEMLGYDYRDLKLAIRGRNLGQRPFAYNPVHNEYIINTYLNVKDYAPKLEWLFAKRDVKWFHGYPSSIYQFILECESAFGQEGVRRLFKGVRGLLLSSEFPLPYMKEKFNGYGLNWISWYGHTEMCVLAYDRDCNNRYRPFATYGLAEVVNGHLIGTSFHNFDMPLIRYDTADIATVSQKVGQRGRIVDRIDGRNGDCIYLPDGTHVATLSALFTGTKNIVEAQIHQQQDYSLVIRYVPKNEQYADDLELVKNMLVDRIGSHTVPFSFVRMEKLPRTARGKLRYIVSDVKR